MEEILQELIKTTLEKGPQNKQFYSNLSITKSIHDHVEIQSRLCDSVSYLLSRYKLGEGFQSKLFTNRNCAIEFSRIHGNTIQLPKNVKETLSSILVLDLLCNGDDLNEELILPEFHEIISLPEEIREGLQDFIVPTWGITTFNLFKNSESPEDTSSSLSPTPSPQLLNIREECDSGNDSPTSMNSFVNQEAAIILSPDTFPDDINTTALTLSVLLNQGILQPKPAESVVRWIISKIFTTEEDQAENGVITESIIFPTLITSGRSHQKSDPVAVANFLKLLYILDISHEELKSAAEKWLVMTLESTIESESKSFISYENSRVSDLALLMSSSGNELGKPSTTIISSASNEQKREIEAIQENPFKLQHHSPDSFLYFLSRILTNISKKCGGNGSANNNGRMNMKRMMKLLVDLLDLRLGTTVDTCDLAMRILAGIYLGLVMPSQANKKFNNNLNNASKLVCGEDQHEIISTEKLLRINNLLQKEFELLNSLQDPLDGSWPADSIIQIELLRGSGENEPEDGNNGRDGAHNLGDKEEQYVIGYLGGKEMSTLFAIKAISAFISVRKSNSEDLDQFEDDLEKAELCLEDHHLY